MKTKSNKSIEMLINEVLLLEAKETAEFLIKLNYDALKKEKPDLRPIELHKMARVGPIYSLYMIQAISELDRPGGYERPFIKWLGDLKYTPSFESEYHNINYVYDWYIGDENAKNAIYNMRLDDAIDAADEWHESLKKKNFDTDIASEGKTKVVYTFPNGSKIVELSWEDCDAEGASMGHCVGTIHSEYVKSGEEKIFSLRSETNKPHVTISVNPKNNEVLEIKGRENKVPVEKHAKLVKEWLKTTNLYYAECDDYINILNANELKQFLHNVKISDIDHFYSLIFYRFIYSEHFNHKLSRKDLTKIGLGVAMSCVHLTQDVERTTELLSVIRDWTNGKVKNRDTNIARRDLLELYYNSNYLVITSIAYAVATFEVCPGGDITGNVTDVAAKAVGLGITKQSVISSIEKEIEMPLEDFLLKNASESANESLIRDFINLYS